MIFKNKSNQCHVAIITKHFNEKIGSVELAGEMWDKNRELGLS